MVIVAVMVIVRGDGPVHLIYQNEYFQREDGDFIWDLFAMNLKEDQLSCSDLGGFCELLKFQAGAQECFFGDRLD